MSVNNKVKCKGTVALLVFFGLLIVSLFSVVFIPWLNDGVINKLAIAIFCFAVVLLGCCAMICITVLYIHSPKEIIAKKTASEFDEKLIERVLQSSLYPKKCYRKCCRRLCDHNTSKMK